SEPSLSPTARRDAEDEGIVIGDSDSMRYVMSRIDQVAPTDATVLLHGETGTGKELLARAVHHRSPRRDRPFVVVNCAAMPAALIESELFGRERGAFTGAHATQIGRFELANRGTIFLDEIGELPLEVQPKLLRVLQEGQVERLGNPRTVDVDVRVVAATNRDLTDEVRENRFRADLYYRLNVFPITIPSLRQRREDIPALVRHLVDRLGRELRRRIETIPEDVIATLQRYEWLGNVRELENILQRAIIVSRNGVLAIGDAWVPPLERPASSENVTMIEVERRHIARILGDVRWRIEGSGGAAQMLGMKPSTLRSRMLKLGIARPRQN
ncbi:MAG: sigma-54 interaction domain-containing protein, partial [Vicinamibacterales bacterium]